MKFFHKSPYDFTTKELYELYGSGFRIVSEGVSLIVVEDVESGLKIPFSVIIQPKDIVKLAQSSRTAHVNRRIV